MKRMVAAVSTLALLLAPLAVNAPAAAAAGVAVDRDIDGDGQPDVVMGWRAGIDVQLSRSGVRQRITAAWLGQPNDEIGASYTVGDVDGDGYADLVAGVENASGAGLASVVLIAYGSASGLQKAGVTRLTPDSIGLEGELGVGYSAALVGSPGHRFLALGGESHFISLLSTGTRSPTLVKTVGVDAAAEQALGTRYPLSFGEFLAADGEVLVAGNPSWRINGKYDGGAATIFRISGSEPTITQTTVTQNSPGVPGTTEAFDRFGHSVAVRDGHVAVGVPQEAVGSTVEAGMVQLFTVDPGTGAVRVGRGIDQNSTGVPDSNEAYDVFGTDVAFARGFGCAGATSLVVGVSGETLSGARRAGAVAVVSVAGPTCNRSFSQGTGGLGGSREYNDHVGAAVSVLKDPAGVADQVLIGASDEDVSGVLNAGWVAKVRRSGTGFSKSTYTGSARGDRLGVNLGGSNHFG